MQPEYKTVQAVIAPAPPRPLRSWPVVLLALLVAALIPETVATANTPPLRILFEPTTLGFEMLFYGTAVLLVREALVRGRIGWPGVVALGVAFGGLNEAVVAGTWYTVQPTGDIFVGGIDLAWATALTVFHLFVSIILTVAFLDGLCPRFAGRSLLRRRGIISSTVVMLGLACLGVLAPTYRPDRIVAYLGALALIGVALWLPHGGPRPPVPGRVPGLWQVRWTGFGLFVAFYGLAFFVPPLTLAICKTQPVSAQVIDCLLFVGASVGVIRVGLNWTGRQGWSARHTAALITGALACPIILSVLVPQERATLEPVVTLPFCVLLIIIEVRLARRARQAEPAPA